MLQEIIEHHIYTRDGGLVGFVKEKVSLFIYKSIYCIVTIIACSNTCTITIIIFKFTCSNTKYKDLTQTPMLFWYKWIIPKDKADFQIFLCKDNQSRQIIHDLQPVSTGYRRGRGIQSAFLLLNLSGILHPTLVYITLPNPIFFLSKEKTISAM